MQGAKSQKTQLFFEETMERIKFYLSQAPEGWAGKESLRLLACTEHRAKTLLNRSIGILFLNTFPGKQCFFNLMGAISLSRL